MTSRSTLRANEFEGRKAAVVGDSCNHGRLLTQPPAVRYHARHNLRLDRVANYTTHTEQGLPYITTLRLWCYTRMVERHRCPVTPMSACYPDRPVVICNYPKTAPSL